MFDWSKRTAHALLGFSGFLFVLGIVLEVGLQTDSAAVISYVLAACGGLLFVIPSAVQAVRRLTADINTLMGIAVLGALIMGLYKLIHGELDVELFRDAAVVIFLYQIGEALEDWSYEKTESSIKDVMDLAPNKAHVVHGDVIASDTASYAHLQISDVALEDVALGQIVKVLPGDRVPLDGVIVEGSSAFNEAPVTGESIPQDKTAGQTVYGGSLNTTSPVFVRVEATYDGGMLARIVSMVEGAQKAKAPYESFISRFAAVYTPLVVIVALVVGLVVPGIISLVLAVTPADAPAGAVGTAQLALQLTNGAVAPGEILGYPTSNIWMVWISRALTLLVISCPCALVISTPISFVSAITSAARHGVLVKGGACFDTGAHVSAVAFDKTGTLTKGTPHVVAAHPFPRSATPHTPSRYPKADFTNSQLLALAAALEANSTHPLAQAVVASAGSPAFSFAVTNSKEQTGNGVTAELSGEIVAIGKPQFIQQLLNLERLPEAIEAEVVAITDKGATCLLVSQGPVIAGALGLADTVRTTTKEALQELRAKLHMKTVMLTGDARQAAAQVGKEMGFTDIAAELLPHDKVDYINKLEQDNVVAFVGDGVNDAPALAASNLGITMGAAASDTALEVANVALLAGDLEQLPLFFKLSRQTMAVVKENIAFALAVKSIVLVLAMLGLVGMGWAIFADTGVTLLVALNGMRLMLGPRTRF